MVTLNYPSIYTVNYYRNKYDMTWGLMDITRQDGYDLSIEPGILVRAFYAEYFFRSMRPKSPLLGASQQAIWTNLIQSYGQKGKEACYGSIAWYIATTGIWYRGCAGDQVSFGAATVDLWGAWRPEP
jgi:hypothetical protein